MNLLPFSPFVFIIVKALLDGLSGDKLRRQ